MLSAQSTTSLHYVKRETPHTAPKCATGKPEKQPLSPQKYTKQAVLRIPSLPHQPQSVYHLHVDLTTQAHGQLVNNG